MHSNCAGRPNWQDGVRNLRVWKDATEEVPCRKGNKDQGKALLLKDRRALLELEHKCL